MCTHHTRPLLISKLVVNRTKGFACCDDEGCNQALRFISAKHLPHNFFSVIHTALSKEKKSGGMSSVMIARLCQEPSLNPAFRLLYSSSVSQPGASAAKRSTTMYSSSGSPGDSFNVPTSQPTTRPALNRRPTLLSQSGLYVISSLLLTASKPVD